MLALFSCYYKNMITTYINKTSGEVINTSLYPGKNWSPVRKVITEEGKEVLRFELNGATIDLEEVESK